MDHYADDLVVVTTRTPSIFTMQCTWATQPVAGRWCATWPDTARAGWPKQY